MIPAISAMLERYRCESADDYDRALREIIQENFSTEDEDRLSENVPICIGDDVKSLLLKSGVRAQPILQLTASMYGVGESTTFGLCLTMYAGEDHEHTIVYSCDVPTEILDEIQEIEPFPVPKG